MENRAEDRLIKILTGGYLSLAPDFEALADRIVELDLGCGKGSFTTALAKKYPDRTVLAADVMINRLRKLVKRNQREGIDNMEALRVEAATLICMMLPDNSIDRLHILCPDPWPKSRHRYHRLVCSNICAHFRRVLRKDGTLHFATDDRPYFEASFAAIRDSGLFSERPDAISDISEIKTDFERKWNSMGLEVFHTAWRKIGD